MNTHQNRIGTFKLSDHLMRRWEELVPLMGNFVVLRCEHDFASQTFCYTAYSPLFEPWPEHCCAPEYEITIMLNDFGPAQITAEKLPKG